MLLLSELVFYYLSYEEIRNADDVILFEICARQFFWWVGRIKRTESHHVIKDFNALERRTLSVIDNGSDISAALDKGLPKNEDFIVGVVCGIH